MRKCLALALLLYSLPALCDEVTWTCVNFSQTTVSASAAGLQFANCVNVLVTDNNNGHSIMLFALGSGSTGAATSFTPGPPLIADYNGAGADSVLVATGGHTFLSGTMEDSGRLEAEWPDRAGAFLSRFNVTFVDSTVLTELGTSAHWEPEGSVSLTLAETTFDGTTLGGTLGGGQFTITTTGVVPENASLFLFGTGMAVATVGVRRYWR